MKRFLQSCSFLLVLAFGLSTTLNGQTCVTLGDVVGELTPVLKDNGQFCPTPAVETGVCDCPDGFVAVGYVGLEGNSYGGMVLSQFSLRCRQLNIDGTLGGAVDITCANGSDVGNMTDGPIDAAAGEALVGFESNVGCAVDGLEGYSKSILEVAAGDANGNSNIMTEIGGMGGSAQPVMYVPDGNVIIGMRTYEDPGNNISAGFAWRYAPIQTVACPADCPLTDISLSNASACDDNGTPDIASDDFFTADVTVTYLSAPTDGSLEVTGSGNLSISAPVASIGANSYTFTNVQLRASGLQVPLSASFTSIAGCTLNDLAGNAPQPCSPDAPGIPTMSEWGLILFALIMFTLSVVFGTQYQQKLAFANTGANASAGTKLPFNKQAFFKALPWVYLVIAAIFAVAIVFGYEPTNADLPGSLFAGAIIAYLVQYVSVFSKKSE